MKMLNMTEGNFFKKILIFSIPVMLSGILQLLFNAVDMVVIGQFGKEGSLAAVGSTSSLINFITNLFIGVSIGANVVVAKSIGAKNDEAVRRNVHTAIAFSLISGLFLVIFGFFTARFWLSLMDTTEDSINRATIYLKIYFMGSIFNMVYNFGAAILRSIGETKRPLYYLTIAGFLNALLNLLFVIVFKMDVKGVALATIISQGFSAIMVILFLVRTDSVVKLKIKEIRIYKKELGKMVLVGLPAGIQSCLISVSNVFIQSAVNSFKSTVIVTGNTAAQNIEGFVWTSMNSFYQASITFTSQNYGANKINNCKKIILICMLYAFITGLILGYSAYFLRDILVHFYTSGESVKYANTRLTIILLTYFLCGLMDIPVGALRGLGKSTIPMVVSILGMVVFRIIWILTIFHFNHKLWVLYISYPISWIMTALVHYICFIFVYKKRYKESIKYEALLS
ncbi:MAG: MATE family efflux transporter [Acholeplasmatales bacterium]|nr:MATE family efflux transporter [Acholeplasmatales bacterium]